MSLITGTTILLTFLTVFVQGDGPSNEKILKDDYCTDVEDYFVEHCPVQKGDYNGCCLCTQYYYYGCECCKEVVDAVGVMGDCLKWGDPTDHDDFCVARESGIKPEESKESDSSQIIIKDYS